MNTYAGRRDAAADRATLQPGHLGSYLAC